MNKKLKILGFIFGFIYASTSIAAEYEAEARIGIGYSDNITREPDNEIDQIVSAVGFDFSVTEDTSRLDLDLVAQFDYLIYEDDFLDSELIGGLDGTATITLIDERLRWLIEDNFGQELSDPFEAARPGNREDVNFFTTGPTLSLLAGGRSQLDISGRYTNVSFEERPSDNERLSAIVTIGRDLNRDANLSLNVTSERIEFDNGGLSPDFDRNEAYVSYLTTGAKNSIELDIGYNEVDIDGIDSLDGVLARLLWTRQVSASGTMAISAGSDYSDQGNIFRYNQNISGRLFETIDVLGVDAPFTHNYFSASYALERTRYEAEFSVDWSQEDYESGLNIDRDIYRSSARFRRDVSRKIFVSGVASFARREFKYIVRRDDDLALGLSAGYRFTPGLSISFIYRHFQRNSIAVDADYKENSLFVRLAYTPVWSRRR